MLKQCIALVLFVLPVLAQAELSAEAVMNRVYERYDKKLNCWHANDKDEHYCMKIEHSAKVDTASGQRLYVLATGDMVDEKGEYSGGHANSGLVGAFVVEEQQGKLAILHADAYMTYGSNGIAPRDWTFVKLGANDYWGWWGTTGWIGQGYSIAQYAILAPYGKKIRDLAGFNQSYDDSGACREDSEAACAKISTSINTSLDIDSSVTDVKVFPLKISVTGSEKGQDLGSKTWVFPFDEKKWSYTEPDNWTLKDKQL